MFEGGLLFEKRKKKEKKKIFNLACFWTVIDCFEVVVFPNMCDDRYHRNIQLDASSGKERKVFCAYGLIRLSAVSLD